MDRTNVTENGYTYNGQNYTNQNRTDSQGSKYTVAIPSTVPASYLDTPKNDIQITTPSYNTQGQQAQIQQAQGYINGSLQTAEQQANMEAEQQKNAYNAANTDLARLQSELGGKAGDIANAYNQTDQNGNSVNTLAGKLRQLSAQSQALGYQNTIIPSQIQNNIAGTGATDRGIAPIQAGQLRNNMIQQATLAMQTAIVNADYQTAKGYADQIVEAKYDQRLADIEAKKTNINNIMFNLDGAQKKAASATLARLEKEKQQYEEQKTNDKAISDMMINASTQGAPADVLERAKKMQDEGAKSSDVAMALGQYAGDYYAIEKIKAEIKKMNAEASKAAAEASKSRSAGSGGSGAATYSVGANGQVLTSKSPADAWLTQFNAGTMSLEDIYTKIGTSKSAEAIKNELARKIADQNGKRIVPLDDKLIKSIDSQIQNIDDLIGIDGYNYKVISGQSQGGFLGFGAKITGAKADALATASNLISNQTLQALADAKEKGITFGALSDAELNTVVAAASSLASKAIKDDKGKLIGFDGSESGILADLNKIKAGLIQAKTKQTGVVDSGVAKADQADTVLQNSNDPTLDTGNYNFGN